MAMRPDEIEELLKLRFPDAEIQLDDMRGDGDHYAVHIASAAFAGKSRVEQHRMVQEAMQGKLGTELHALAIQTSVKE